jgi:hypothetical protein
MFVDNLLKQVQTECLVAFAHSRITGVAGKGEDGVEVFNNRFVQKDAVAMGKNLAEAIKDLATIETINQKISNIKSIALANMYHHHYSKLTKLMDGYIKTDQGFIEGLVGVHLLAMATQKGYLATEDNSTDNLQYYLDAIALYENEKYVGNEDIKDTVFKMREVSEKIFDDYWKKVKKTNSKNKRKAS